MDKQHLRNRYQIAVEKIHKHESIERLIRYIRSENVTLEEATEAMQAYYGRMMGYYQLTSFAFELADNTGTAREVDRYIVQALADMENFLDKLDKVVPIEQPRLG